MQFLKSLLGSLYPETVLSALVRVPQPFLDLNALGTNKHSALSFSTDAEFARKAMRIVTMLIDAGADISKLQSTDDGHLSCSFGAKWVRIDR